MSLLFLSVCKCFWPVFLVSDASFCLVDAPGLHLDKLGSTVFVVLGNHPCLPPVDLAVSENPRRDSVCCLQVVRFVRCSRHAVDPRLQLVFWIVLLDSVEAAVAASWLLSSCSLRSWLVC